MTPVRGALQVESARSRTGMYPPNQAVLNQLRTEAESQRLTATRLSGLGAIDVPEWAWYAAGGVAIGAVAGYFLLKRKR
jgi:LPXTG-motif cell wall-anchored protein